MLRPDGPTDGRMDGRTDTPSYRDATVHLKMQFFPAFEGKISKRIQVVIHLILTTDRMNNSKAAFADVKEHEQLPQMLNAMTCR